MRRYSSSQFTSDYVSRSETFRSVLFEIKILCILLLRIAIKTPKECTLNLSLGLSTADVPFKVVKVKVTPLSRADVNQPNMATLANEFLDVPSLTNHGLMAFPSGLSDNL